MFSRFYHFSLRTAHRAATPRPTRHYARIAAVSGGLLLGAGYVHADPVPQAVGEPKQSLGSLIRSYTVFTMCSVPGLVDLSPKLLDTFTSVPGLRQITEALVRITFFNHFAGGDNVEGTVPLLHALRKANKGALLAYSVEVDSSLAPGSYSGDAAASKEHFPQKQIMEETIRCIDAAAKFEDSLKDGARRTWVAIKITALLPNAQALINLSSHILHSHSLTPDSVPFPGCPRSTDLDAVLQPTIWASPLSKEDIGNLHELYEDLRRACAHARERGVKLIIDAEHSWYQPAIDALTHALMREFNNLADPKSTVQPLVYATYQAYLRRTPSHLALSLEDARKNNYALGVKLVRGAYHPYEVIAHQLKGTSSSISPDELPPVWSEKEETDKCYNQCIKLLLNAVREDVQGGTPEAQAFLADETRASRIPQLTANLSDSVRQLSRGKPNTFAKPVSIGVLFGTHNWESAKLILEELMRNKLATPLPGEPREKNDEVALNVKPEAVERIAIGQLHGMSDDLTEYLVSRAKTTTPFIIKYVPYGALEQVMPYLCRRGIENKSILGNGKATHERQRAGKEIWKRITGA